MTRSASKRHYDVFISYASEDRLPFVHSLVNNLRRCGLSVWYDHLVLKVGQSLRKAIEDGILASRFSIVVLSPHYFEKLWTLRELDALLVQVPSSDNTLLPVLHNLQHEELRSLSPILASRFALSSDEGAESIATEVSRVVTPEVTVHYERFFGQTTVLILHDFGLVFLRTSEPTKGDRATRVFEFSGEEIDYNYFAKALTPAPEASGGMFDFNGSISLYRMNHALCSSEEVENGVVIQIDEARWCQPLCVYPHFTLGVMDDKIAKVVTKHLGKRGAKPIW